MKTTFIIVNEKQIPILTEGTEKYVAIKPICEAIGVDFQTQLDKIKEDEIIGQLYTLRGMTGADGKTYKMGSIPLKFVFGWIFTINPKNVKEEVKPNVLKYKLECYEALFDHFTKRTSILKERTSYQIEIEELESELEEDERVIKLKQLKQSVKNASQRLNALDKDQVEDQLDLFKNKS
jgi:hypothetical protein